MQAHVHLATWVLLLLFRNFTHIAPAHPAVASMDQWVPGVNLGKQMTNCPCLAEWCLGCYRTLGYAISHHETCELLALLQKDFP